MIQVENLTRTYGSTKAVDAISFSIEKGEIVGFLGPNGAGKSTTMRILAGSLAATSGRATIGGFDVANDPTAVKRITGYLPERPPLYLDMTVRGYLQFCAKIKQAEKPFEAVEEQIVKVGLESVAHRLIINLSKGYRQRVGIAQALVHNPQVLILDEPVSGLDPAQRAEIRNLISSLAGGDVTVILSTHVLQEVEAICDRALIIKSGVIVASDTIEQLAGAGKVVVLKVAATDTVELLAALTDLPNVTHVRLGNDDDILVEARQDVRADVARLAVDYGLLALSSGRGLEQVFIELTRKEEANR